VFADLPAASEPSVGDAPMTMRSPDERHGRNNMRQTWGSSDGARASTNLA
jgi:hypothetical protein